MAASRKLPRAGARRRRFLPRGACVAAPPEHGARKNKVCETYVTWFFYHFPMHVALESCTFYTSLDRLDRATDSRAQRSSRESTRRPVWNSTTRYAFLAVQLLAPYVNRYHAIVYLVPQNRRWAPVPQSTSQGPCIWTSAQVQLEQERLRVIELSFALVDGGALCSV